MEGISTVSLNLLRRWRCEDLLRARYRTLLPAGIFLPLCWQAMEAR